jgi:phage-related protein
MPEIVGSAYVRIRAITADLARDIREGVEKGASDADIDKSGQNIGNRISAGAKTSMQKGMRDALKDSTKNLHRDTDVDRDGQSIGRQLVDSIRTGWNKELPRFQKEFEISWQKVLLALVPLTYSFASLTVPIIAGAVNLIAQYIISLVGQIGFLVTAAVGGGAAMGAAFGAIALGVAPIVIALKKTTPQLESFLTYAKDIGEEWLDTAEDFQAELLPALRDVLESTTKLIPAFREFGVSVTRDVAEALRRVSDEILNNEERLGRFQAALGSSSDQTGTAASVIDNFAEALANVATVALDLFIAAIPLADRFSESVLRLTENWRLWMEDVRTTGVLDQTLNTWYERARLLAEGLGDFFVGVFNILRIGADSAAPFFTAFNDFAERFRAFTETPEGRSRIQEVFDKAMPVAREFHLLVKDIITAIADPIFDSDTSGLVGFLHTLRVEVLPWIEENIAHHIEELSGPLKEASVALLDFLMRFSESGALKITLEILKTFLEVLTLLLSIPGMDEFLGAILGISSAFLVLGAVLGPITKGFGTLVTLLPAIKVIGLIIAQVFATITYAAQLFAAVVVQGLLISPLYKAIAAVIFFRDEIGGAFIWLYQHALLPIGRAFQAVWNAITDGAGEAWQILQTVWDGILVGAGFIIAAFGQLWQVVQTVWDGILTVISTAWGIISTIFRAIADIVLFVLKPVFEDLWFFLQGIWNAITTVIVFAFQVIRGIFLLLAAAVFEILIFAFNALGPVVSTVWNAIVAAISFAWGIIQVIWNAIVWFIQTILVPIFQWLWQQIQAVWDGILATIGIVWSLIQPIWNAIVGFIQTILVPAFQWLWDRLVDIWNGIHTTISTVWGLIQGVWAGLTEWVDANILGPFRTVRDSLADIWNSIWSTAVGIWDSIIGSIKSAVNQVIRAINAVIHGINDVAGIIPGVSEIPDIPELAAGGNISYTRGARGVFARGGIPAANLRRTGPFATSGIRAIVGEGRSGYPEYVIPTDPLFRSRARKLFFTLGADLGLFGRGQRGPRERSFNWRPRPTSTAVIPGFFPGGILGDAIDVVKDIAGNVVGAVREGAVALIFGPFNEIAKNLINLIPIEFLRNSAHGVRKGIYNWLKGEEDKLAITPGAGGGSAKGLVGWAAWYYPFWKALFPWMTIGGWRAQGSVPGSDHPKGKALDLMTSSGAVAQQIISNFLGQHGAKYWIWNRQFSSAPGWGIRGYSGPSPHTDHVHLSYYRRGGVLDTLLRNMPIFDNGGVLAPGINVVANNTGRPEFLSPPTGTTVIFREGSVQVVLPEGVTLERGRLIGRQIGRGINETLVERTVRVDSRLAGG